MPRALRDAEDGLPASSSAPDVPLTCAEAGIQVPRLTDLCADVEVRYLEKQTRDSVESWQQVEAIDTRDALAGRTRSEPRTSVELVDLAVAPGGGEGAGDDGVVGGAAGDARGDGDAIPLVEAMHDHLVTGRLEGFDWELFRLAFNFLHCKDVDVGALKESDDAVDASAD